MTTTGTSTHQVTSEVGRLRTVMLHRPGAELSRLTPRNNADLLFDGVPWLGRAQEEHDGFATALRDRGVEVLYLIDLLVEALEVQAAREAVIAAERAPPSNSTSLPAAVTAQTWLAADRRPVRVSPEMPPDADSVTLG